MDSQKKIGRIGVLAGGPSNEREMSLRSGTAVYKALSEEGFDTVFIDIKEDAEASIKKNSIDAAFIALHGRYGEDGTVQALLERMHIPYTGSGVIASRLALDKIASKDIFIKKSIPVPRYAVISKSSINMDGVAELGLPVVVKPQFEGSSIGLSVVKDRAMLTDAMSKAFLYGENVLVEEFISGRELTVGILGDEALPVIEIVSRYRVYDYNAKYKDASTKYLVPAPIDQDSYVMAQELGRRAHAALGCSSLSRVDMMLDDKGNIFVLEVNTIPGMTERSLLPKAALANGLSFNALCVKLIENIFSVNDKVAHTHVKTEKVQ